MTRTCAECGRIYTARREDSRFCSSTCRARRHKAGARASAGTADTVESGSFADVVRADLVAKGVAGGPIGMLVVELAERLSSPATADASRAPLSREFSRLYEDLVRGVADEDDPLVALKLRYWEKRHPIGVGVADYTVNGRILGDGFPN